MFQGGDRSGLYPPRPGRRRFDQVLDGPGQGAGRLGLQEGRGDEVHAEHPALQLYSPGGYTPQVRGVRG